MVRVPLAQLGMKSKDDEKLEQDYRREGISRPSDRPGERPIVTERVEQTKYEAVGTRSDEPTGYTRQVLNFKQR